MRFSLLFNALTVASAALCVALAATGCATEAPLEEAPPSESALTDCTDPRPQVCTMIWAPVCGVHDDGHQQTHASACNACADSTVRAHSPGSCDNDESTP